MIEPTYSMRTGIATSEQPRRVADRYTLVSELGAGGVGKVALAIDEQTGRRVALKQMRAAAAEDREDLLTLFKREYYTLKQLAHPLFVEVYEYGVDPAGPFFTMELLSGRDLAQCAPLPWPEACRILRDVASGLAMLHSRNLVYRDLSAHNVRLAENGQAKLLDFGALASKDVAHPKVVGTPPYVAPEALHGQPLDARTDLYALGALGYFMITRHHAYSVQRMDQLRDCWRSTPRAPSAFGAPCPKALDELLLSLLSIDPRARPPHAAEVIDRLVAIAGLPPLPEALAARAYFNRPTLVEREPETLLIRKQLLRMLRGRGGALCIEAAPGMGRTRLLEELVLEAKLLGAVVLHASARAGAARYDVVRQLSVQLLAELPEVARAAAVPGVADLRAALPHLVPPDARATASDAEPLPADAEQRWARAQSALCAWLEAVARKRALVIAVDDLPSCDDASAGVLAELALHAGERRMLVAATMRSTHDGTPAKALTTFREHARVITLTKLSSAGTLALYRHVFGDVAYLPELASWAERAAGGSVQHCVELAHDLVDRGVIRYAQGVWVLPSDLHDQALPENLAQAFADRLNALSAAAREVAESLCVAGTAVTLDGCTAFCAGLDEVTVFAALDELLAADLVVCDGQSYAFRQSAIEDAIESRMDDERRRACHRRIGLALVERPLRGVGERLHAARHLLRGGENERGVDLAIAAANAIGELSLEVDGAGIEALELALAACLRGGRPRRDEMTLRLTLLPCAFLFDQALVGYGEPAAEQLERDSGMAFVAEQDPSKSLVERVIMGLGQANERFLRLPEAERVYDPVRSARELGKALLAMQAVYSSRFEIDTAAKCCARFEPLAALTPMAKLCQDAALAAIDALRGRIEPALALQQDVVERSQAMLASMEAAGEGAEPRSVVRALLASIAYVVGLRLLFTKPDESRRLADLIDRVAVDRHKASAAQLRVLACYVTGDADAATRYQAEYEQRLVRFRMHGSSGVDLSYRIRAFELGGDLLALNAAAREAEALSKRRPGYRPFLLLCRGHAFALRGEHGRALAELEQAALLAQPGKHFAWAATTVHKTRALIELGRLADARACVEQARRDNAEHDLGGTLEALLLPTLALLEALEGDAVGATERLRAALQRATADGYPLVIKAELLLASLRVALAAGDGALFDEHSRALRELYRNADHRGIHGAYKRLLERARAAGLIDSAPGSTEGHALAEEQSKIAAAFSVCSDAGARAQCALTLLVDALAAPSGYLFALRGGKLVLAAAPADRPAPPRTMIQSLDAYLSAELADEEVATVTSFDRATETRSEAYEDGRCYRPILLRVNEGGQPVVAGIAAVEVNPQHPIEQPPSWALIGALSERLIHEGVTDPARGS